MNWITENIGAFLADLVGGAIDLFGEFLNNIFFVVVDAALENVYVENANKFITATALLLVSLMVIKVVVSGYLLETDYDPDADPVNLLVKVAQAVALITNASWVFDWLLGVARDFTADLTGNANADGYCAQTASLLNINAVDMGPVFLAHVLVLLFLFLSVLVFSVVAGLRGAELIAMKMFFPFFCLDLLTNSRERWNSFIVAFIAAFFTYAFQVLFFIIAMKSYASVSVTRPAYYVSTMVWMIMAIRAPHFLEKFLFRSGVSSAAAGGLRMVAQTALMRGAMR